MNKNFVSLHSHTTFSIGDGMRKPIDYCKRAKELGMNALAITDHGTMAGFFQFADACRQYAIKPIFGVEAYFVEDKMIKGVRVMGVDKNGKDKEKTVDPRQHVILLAKNLMGYKTLLEAQFDAVKNGFYYKPRIDWTNLEKMASNVICSSACSAGMVAHYIGKSEIEKARGVALRLKNIFKEDFYFEYVALERTKIYGPLWVKMREMAKELKIKSIITLDTHYLHRDESELQDIVHNIGEKITIKDIKEGKGWIFQDRDLYFKNYDETKEIMERIFKEADVEKFLENTNEIASKIEEYNIFPDKDILPQTDFNEEKMKKILKDNLEKKTPKNEKDRYRERLNFEWKSLKHLGLLEYMWVIRDIIEYCQKSDVMIGAGRGSAAGSLLAYLLDITNVDPIKFGLSFERFSNPNRCLKETASIMTKQGIKQMQDLNIGDLVLTNKRLYKRITNIEKRDINEKLISIKYDNGEISCTDNHKFIIIRDGFVKEILTKDLLQTDNLIKYIDRIHKGKFFYCSTKCRAVAQSNGTIKSHSGGISGYRTDLNDGNYYRSSFEADYARYLKYNNIKYKYQCKTFEIQENNRIRKYTPDFFINEDKFIELKGYAQNNNEKYANKIGAQIIYMDDFYDMIKEKKLKEHIEFEFFSYRKAKQKVINYKDMVKIKSIQKEAYQGQVIDIEVKEDHTFWAADKGDFVLTHNSKMLDIDIDFENKRRQEVIQYIRDKYGEDCVSQIANYSLLADIEDGKDNVKQALKDILRIYDVPFSESMDVSRYFDANGCVPEKYQEQYKIAKKLANNIRQFSVHASGVLITDKPIYNYIPTNMVKKKLVSGIDMEFLSKKRFLKVDILGLSSLDVVKLTLQYIKKYEGKTVDLLGLDLEDEQVIKLFKKADTQNIFQFETPNFRKLLKEAQPENFEQLVELNALNRPVTLQLNMHIDYVKRKFGEEYDLPKLLKPHLEKTYGILLYQEQLIAILADLLDISAGEADDIRRNVVVVGFIKGTEKYQDKLYKKYSREDVDATLEMLNKIANYSFNRCLTNDTTVKIKYGGSTKDITIQRLFEVMKLRPKVKRQILSYDIEKQIVDFNDVKEIYDSGTQEVFEIELENGKKIKATKKHKLLTNCGWKTVEDVIINKDTIELAYKLQDTSGIHLGQKAWNKGLTKDTNASLKRLSDKRIGNDHWFRKFGGKPHNCSKTKENYEPLKRISEKLTGREMSIVACANMSKSAIKRERKGSPGKRNEQACRNIGNATLRRHAAGRYPKTYTYPHRLLHKAMIDAGIWDGFNNEVIVCYHSIDICNVKKKIAIQVDGDYFHANPEYMKAHHVTELNAMQKRNRRYETACNTYLKNYGWINLRFWDSEIQKNIEEVIKRIKEVL